MRAQDEDQDQEEGSHQPVRVQKHGRTRGDILVWIVRRRVSERTRSEGNRTTASTLSQASAECTSRPPSAATHRRVAKEGRGGDEGGGGEGGEGGGGEGEAAEGEAAEQGA